MTPEAISAIRRILDPLEPIAVYLFGSRAVGRERPDSDVDLAVLPVRKLSVDELLDSRIRLAEVLSCDVDLVDLAQASTVLRKEVFAGGRLLFETNRLRREEFEMYTLSDYARLNEERAPVLAALGLPLRPHA